MAIKLGITGLPNTGKSFSRRTIKDGENVFVIAPTRKNMHLLTSKNEPIKQLKILGSTNSGTIDDLIRTVPGWTTKAIAFEKINKGVAEGRSSIEGNWAICQNIKDLELYLRFVSDRMPNIKTLILPDFTHYITNVVSSPEFMSRNKGGEVFARFWELAADTLNNFITSIDTLRDDLIVVTEFHSAFDEVSGEYKIFVPAGKMLEEKFLPDSYYDYMLYTHIEKGEDGKVTEASYKFVTRRYGKYNARSSGLFNQDMIPNDLSLVLNSMRKQLGI